MSIYNTNVNDLNLPMRTQNALNRAAMRNVNAVLALGRDRASLIKGLGSHGLEAIERALNELGLTWSDNGQPVPPPNRPRLHSTENPPITIEALLCVANYIEKYCSTCSALEIVSMLRHEASCHE